MKYVYTVHCIGKVTWGKVSGGWGKMEEWEKVLQINAAATTDWPNFITSF